MISLAAADRLHHTVLMKTMPQYAAKFARLSFNEKLLLVKVWGMLWVVRLGLWFVPFRHLSPLLSVSRSHSENSNMSGQASVESIVWSVTVASRFVPKGRNCLLRALVAHFFLVRNCQFSDLHIGVYRNDGGELDAHAWVECDGKIIIGDLPDLSRFTPLEPTRRGK